MLRRTYCQHLVTGPGSFWPPYNVPITKNTKGRVESGGGGGLLMRQPSMALVIWPQINYPYGTCVGTSEESMLSAGLRNTKAALKLLKNNLDGLHPPDPYIRSVMSSVAKLTPLLSCVTSEVGDCWTWQKVSELSPERTVFLVKVSLHFNQL